uniref:RNA helicase n=1 Tax=Kalanchoe fedtschenkoi TaxID=63787 RepID=A0A7N0TZ97_KALFE
MAMYWSDRMGDEVQRGPRASYVPPHLRPNSPVDESRHRFHDDPYAFDSRFGRYSNSRQLGRVSVGPMGRGRGLGRGRGGRGWSQYHGFNRSVPETNSFDAVVEKFGEVEVLDEDGADNEDAINFNAYEDIPVESSGENVPPPVDTFEEIDLGKALNDNIKKCKYVKPTPVQRHAIPIAVAGRDLMACAQTGSGKTAAFCFPIICGILSGESNGMVMPRDARVACPTGLILSPTRELSCQIHGEVKKFAYQTGLKAVVVYGGAPIVQQFRNIEKGVDILVATPGRLVDMIERDRVSLKKIKYLALDEADRMLDMGFEHQIRKIVQQMDMPPPGSRQTMLFSATFPDEIQKLASDFLSNYIFLSVGRVGSSTDLISQKVEHVEDMDKRNRLMDLLQSQRASGKNGKHSLTLVFVETKRGADSLESWLASNGFPATAIHGDKVQLERERALRSFKSGATPIMVATDVASRGLDIPHVSLVINFDMPRAIDDYVHRIGRTGRAGKHGEATAFFNDSNLPIARALVTLMQEAKQEVPAWLKECAGKSSHSPGDGGGGGGRSNRHRGGSKFGGYDYRSDAANVGHSISSSHHHYVDPRSYVNPYSTGSYVAVPYSAPYVADPGFYPNHYGYAATCSGESVPENGWD